MSHIEIEKKLNPPKNKRLKRAMEDKAPKTIENPKTQIVLRGTKTSPVVNQVLKDLHQLKDPLSKCLFRRLENTVPFENLGSIQFLAKKNDCSLFVYGTHNKKRPNNIVFGRLFDFELLDMFEFGINPDTFVSTLQFSKYKDPDSKDKSVKSFRFASKPAIIFQGSDFENNYALKEIRLFFLDYFKGIELKKLDLMGLDHVIIITAVLDNNNNNDDNDDNNNNRNNNNNNNNEIPKLYFRHYCIEYHASNNPKIPYIYLRELGPSFDLTLRRYETGNASQTKDKSINMNKLNSIANSFDTNSNTKRASSLNNNNDNNNNKNGSINNHSNTNSNVDLMKKALVSQMDAKKKILNLKPKQKNVFLSKVFNERKGKIFINKQDQDLNKLKTKKMKALRRVMEDNKNDDKKGGNNNNQNKKNRHNQQKRNQQRLSEKIKSKFNSKTKKLNKMKSKGRGKRKFR